MKKIKINLFIIINIFLYCKINKTSSQQNDSVAKDDSGNSWILMKLVVVPDKVMGDGTLPQSELINIRKKLKEFNGAPTCFYKGGPFNSQEMGSEYKPAKLLKTAKFIKLITGYLDPKALGDYLQIWDRGSWNHFTGDTYWGPC